MTADGSVKTIPGAYFYRMIAPCYKCDDPLIGKYAESFRYNKTELHGKGPAWDATGVIVWNDWKPIVSAQSSA